MSAISKHTIDAAYDSISIKDGANALAIDSSGRIGVNVNGTVTISNLTFANDKVDVSGSEVSLSSATLAALETINATQSGAWEVSLSSASLAALENVTVSATDLDIRNLAFSTDKVDVSGSSISTIAAAFDIFKVTVEAVSATAAQMVATPLASRLSMIIENTGSQDVFLGASNAVTAALGFKLPKGTSIEINLGVSATLWAITASGAGELRIMELAD